MLNQNAEKKNLTTISHDNKEPLKGLCGTSLLWWKPVVCL